MAEKTMRMRYTVGRLLDGDVQRIMRNGAMRYGVRVSLEQVRGWLSHEHYWTIVGESSQVDAYCVEAKRVFDQLAEES